MSPSRRLLLLVLVWTTLVGGLVADASAAGTGGAAPPPDAAAAVDAGGVAPPTEAVAATGREAGGVTYGSAAPPRPVARVFQASPSTMREGRRVRLAVRVEEPGVRTVSARVVFLGPGGAVRRRSLGRIRVGRLLRVTGPRLGAGAWTVRLHVRDPARRTLARSAPATGIDRVRVTPRPAPRPAPAPVAAPAPAPSAPAPSAPAPSAPASGGVFPVAGPYSFGGADGRFGAPRRGHIHEGQDMSAASGTPVVAPVAGTVRIVDYQAGGAGHYIVLDADDGRAMFFAHLRAGSIVVTPGQRVRSATTLGEVGSTGSSSGPHLHFEIWQGGWRDRGGRPIDPLPQLQAWAR